MTSTDHSISKNSATGEVATSKSIVSNKVVSEPSTALHSPKPPLRIAINGFGRIGRNVLRALIERFNILGRSIHLVAINDIADPHTLLHLLKFDSTHGRLSELGVTVELVNKALKNSLETTVSAVDTQLCIQKADKSYYIDLLSTSEPQNLPWSSFDIDVVLECTGLFRSYKDASRHLQAGAKQVIVGAAPFDEVDASIVMGVNDDQLTRQLPIISSVSCTTQALVPLIDVLDRTFGAKSVMMTEIHAVTADQNVLDQPHRDLRRARAAGHNIIPTTSSSIAATERTLPNMRGKIQGHSIRVPTIDVAAIDVNFVFEKYVDIETVREVLKAASAPESPLHNIMSYTDELLVSSDFIHQPESLIIDGEQLMQVGEQVKVFAWYDNEWGYANRLLDMCVHLQKA